MLSRLDPYALVGSVLGGRYSLEAFVGIGRYSAVYRAKDAKTHGPVAVRLLKVRPDLPASRRDDVVRRLRGLVPPVQDVAKECATFTGMLDVGAIVTAEGRWLPAIVQPWLGGETLETGLEDERWRSAAPPSRTLGRAIEWMTPVADALTYAHARGLVHGSIAPRNIFVRPAPDTRIDLLDLGLVSALTTLQAQDTAFAPAHEGPIAFFATAYASPEHFTSLRMAAGSSAPSPLVPASDVFSLALLMVELLTGRAPLGEGDDTQLEAAVVDPLVRPTPCARGRDLGGYLEAIFERALAVKPSDRHPTVESFWSALRAASRLTLRPTSSVTPPPVEAPPVTVSAPTAPVNVAPVVAPVAPVALVTPIAALAEAPPPTQRATPVEEIVTRAVSYSSPPANERPERDDTPPCDTVLHGAGRCTGAPVPSSRRGCETPRSEVVCSLPAAKVRPMALSNPGDVEEGDLAMGQIIAGKYAVERLLGRGGMGAVWLCTHLGLGERVAVKVMSRSMADNTEIRARFAREARAAAKIKSRYVARVYDTGELADLRPFIVMEYMEGETLAQALQGGRALSLEDTVRILGQVGRGLTRAHELGIIHRDVKPENVFLAHTSDDGVLAKVFDFGIVKVADSPNDDGATREGLLIGTPHYMSPEQADGLAIDSRSDIYSIGLMAFRMLTGKRPFDGDSIMNVLLKICTHPLPSLTENVPDLPPGVDAWFTHACARNRERRFRTAIECVDALASAAGLEGIRDVSLLPPPPSLDPRSSRREGSPASFAPQSADITPGPHELSCPTLLDEMPDVLDDDGDDDEPEHASFLLVTQKRPSFVDGVPGTDHARAARQTNPLFGGECAVPASGVEPLQGAALRRRSRVRRSRAMLAFSGVAVACAIGAAAFNGQLSDVVAVGETASVAAAAAPAPPPAAPAAKEPAPSESHLTGAIIERTPAEPPVAAPAAAPVLVQPRAAPLPRPAPAPPAHTAPAVPPPHPTHGHRSAATLRR